jgi:hypothetical protein
VDDAIENGVADRRLADHLMPGHGELAGDQNGAAAVATVTLIQNLQHSARERHK